MKLIDKNTLVAEINGLISNGKLKCQQSQENNDRESYIAWSEHIATCGKILSFLNTIEVKDIDLENYNKVKRTLSLSFMNFLDSNRPEGKMCLSNGECFDIDKAFDEMDFAKLFIYMKKYLKIL